MKFRICIDHEISNAKIRYDIVRNPSEKKTRVGSLAPQERPKEGVAPILSVTPVTLREGITKVCSVVKLHNMQSNIPQ